MAYPHDPTQAAVEAQRLDAPDDFIPPQKFDEYQVIRRLGSGTMGQVYLCLDSRLDRRVAIKFLHHVSLDLVARERFWTEARAIARLSHPNVVAVHRLGEVAGLPYIVSEFVDGESMEKLALPISWQAALNVGVQIAGALASAHRRQVLHRDIKPANIMLTAEGEVKLLDFGLAKLTDSFRANAPVKSGEVPVARRGALALNATASDSGHWIAAGNKASPEFAVSDLPLTKNPAQHTASPGFAGATGLTQTGTMMGTPIYMAPEAWNGQSVAGYTDVYSLGAVLYELVAGHPPHGDATTLEELYAAVVNDDVRPLTQVARGADPHFAAIVERCLRRKPAERYASAEPLYAAFAALAATTSSRSRRRHLPRWLGGSLVAGATVLLGLGGIYLGVTWSPTGMATVHGGTFLRGSTAVEVDAAHKWCVDELGDDKDCPAEVFQREQPLQQVYISPFRIDRTEVTNQQFADWLNSLKGLRVTEKNEVYQGSVLLANLYPAYRPSAGVIYDVSLRQFSAPSGFERRPMTQLTWDAAYRYCQAHHKNLPTESEWEFAARGTTARRFPWGHEVPTCQGVVVSRDEKQPCAQLGAGPQEVGTALQDHTPDHIYDLAGNVSEWVRDRFLPRYPSCPSPCRDPVVFDPQESKPVERVVRGGNWALDFATSRGAGRSRWPQNDAPANVGFRCVVAGP